MHARDGAAHDRGGDDGCRHRRRLQTMGVETDAEREEGQRDRHEDRNHNQRGIIPQQRLRPHRGHSRIVHRRDPGTHKHRADGQSAQARRLRFADRGQGDAARQHSGNHRQHRAKRVIGDPAGEREGEHADEVHRPNAAAHADRARGGPGVAGAPRRGGGDAPGN